MSVQILYRTVGRWKENSYLLLHNNKGWLIDPGDGFTMLDHEFNCPGITILGIINTHGHFDHLGAVSAFKEKYSLPFYIHSKDKQLVHQANLYRKLAGDNTVIKTPAIDFFLDDSPGLLLEDKKIIIHHTPGHSHGSVCFEVDHCLISGDLLFEKNIGRTDLPGGNLEMLKSSIKFVLHNFQGYTIYPGHGQPFVLDSAVIEGLNKLL